ncbi:DNA replication and repair protein RecO [Roseinatronobacter thiooxidans]|uniref:DNA repair protein RecO n=1 Tax=Roseinatronobacter thiooxidans TaxID=121821 RepID=A0A2W7QFM2_9RHOB|nr:DNA repair protein RecO [Roseinatronobacter thiooxidans]PZX46186.1 DNA replication and repair protein RecO [Roseinatronobacter thiooxidans]
MEWRDEGILLAMRPHGEATAIIEVFSAVHGRHAGVVHGGASRKMAPILQPGAQLDLAWRARLEEHMGSFTVELIRARAALVLSDRLALAGLSAICALCRYALPERQASATLYAATVALMDRLGQPGWLRDYALWELTLLEETGFGLDLQQCAVTGTNDGLAYVSPRTGRAVTASAAGEFAPRLLPLPAGLVSDAVLDATSVRQALHLSGYFLHHWLADAMGRPLPEARARLVSQLG